MRLIPLRNDSAHPPEGEFGVACQAVDGKANASATQCRVENCAAFSTTGYNQVLAGPWRITFQNGG
jgi:hypothetical protein